MSTTPAMAARFTALDGWRGLCALLVAIYHFHTTSHFQQVALVRHAYLFVDFFFVLSGFVITHAYSQRIATARDAGTMIWRRLGRLWPLHVALLGAFVALELASPIIAAMLGASRSAASAFDPASGAQLPAIATNFLLLHGLGIHDRLTWNFPSWSISTELWTYVIFGVVALATRGRMLLAALAIALVGWSVVACFSTRMIAVDFELGLFRCLAGFFVGHVAFRLMQAHPVKLAAPTVWEVAAVVSILTFVSLAGRTRMELAAPIVFGAVVWLFALERGAVSRLLQGQPFAMLGLVSYSIYMVHALVIVLVHRMVTVLEQLGGLELSTTATVDGSRALVVSFGTPWAMDAVVGLYVMVVIGLAMLSWRYIEMPCQRLWNGKAAAQGSPLSLHIGPVARQAVTTPGIEESAKPAVPA